jgi:Tfp pilus assembly protein PilO
MNLSKNLHFVVLALFFLMTMLDYEAHLSSVDEAQKKIPAARAKITKSKKKLKELKTFEENLVVSKKRVEEIATRINEVQKQLPTQISDTEVLDFIAKESSSINIKDSVINPKEEELNGFYYAKKYGFQGQGTFLQILVLFERIFNAERLFNIDKVVIKQSKEEFQKGRFHTVGIETEIESYRYNTEYQEKSGVAEIEKKFAKPKKKKRRRKKEKKRKK